MSTARKSQSLMVISGSAAAAFLVLIFLPLTGSGDKGLMDAHQALHSGMLAIYKIAFLASLAVFFIALFRLRANTLRIICPNCQHETPGDDDFRGSDPCPACRGDMRNAIIKKSGFNTWQVFSAIVLLLILLTFGQLYLSRKTSNTEASVMKAVFNVPDDFTPVYSVASSALYLNSLSADILLPEKLTKEQAEQNVRSALRDLFTSQKAPEIILTGRKRIPFGDPVLCITAYLKFTGQYDASRNIPLSSYYLNVEIQPRYFAEERPPIKLNETVYLCSPGKKETDLYLKLDETRETLEMVYYSVPNNSAAVISNFRVVKNTTGRGLYYYKVNVGKKSGWVSESVVFPEKQ